MLRSTSNKDSSRGFHHQFDALCLGRGANSRYLKEKIQVLDRTKALYGPRTKAYGETKYSKKNYKFWTKPRPCMVPGLRPMGKPSTEEKLQVLDRTKALCGPRTQAYGETKYSKNYKFWIEPRPCVVLGLKPMGKPSTQKTTSFGQNQGLV